MSHKGETLPLRPNERGKSEAPGPTAAIGSTHPFVLSLRRCLADDDVARRLALVIRRMLQADGELGLSGPSGHRLGERK